MNVTNRGLAIWFITLLILLQVGLRLESSVAPITFVKIAVMAVVASIYSALITEFIQYVVKKWITR